MVWKSIKTHLSFVLFLVDLSWFCQAPNPGPTRLADPNRFPGRETQDWDSLPDFFFFKSQLAPMGMAHIL